MASISTVPNQFDIQLYQGAPLLAVMSIVDATGIPLNMTGGSIICEVRSTQARSGNNLIVAMTVTWVDASQGQFNLSLTSEQTDALSFAGNAYWDCFYADNNTPVNYNPLFWGTVTLQVDVSY